MTKHKNKTKPQKQATYGVMYCLKDNTIYSTSTHLPDKLPDGTFLVKVQMTVYTSNKSGLMVLVYNEDRTVYWEGTPSKKIMAFCNWRPRSDTPMYKGFAYARLVNKEIVLDTLVRKRDWPEW